MTYRTCRHRFSPHFTRLMHRTENFSLGARARTHTRRFQTSKPSSVTEWKSRDFFPHLFPVLFNNNNMRCPHREKVKGTLSPRSVAGTGVPALSNRERKRREEVDEDISSRRSRVPSPRPNIILRRSSFISLPFVNAACLRIILMAYRSSRVILRCPRGRSSRPRFTWSRWPAPSRTRPFSTARNCQSDSRSGCNYGAPYTADIRRYLARWKYRVDSAERYSSARIEPRVVTTYANDASSCHDFSLTLSTAVIVDAPMTHDASF